MDDFMMSLGLDGWLDSGDLRILARVIVLLFIGIPVVFALRRTARAYATSRYSQHSGMVAGKVVWYAGVILIVILVMHQLHIDMTPLLGAAGVVGLALGFASQTSVSNVISGFFLLAEKSFVVGDEIVVGGTTGTVISIDTLSVKLRTVDNRYVRIPNETMIKTEVTNVSRFPIGRVDLRLGVAYKEDISRVKKLLFDLAHRNPLVFDDPSPVYIFTALGNSSVDIQFSVWTNRSQMLRVKNEMYESIKARFDQEGIEIPYPHVSVYKGEASDPFQVQVLLPENLDMKMAPKAEEEDKPPKKKT